MSSEVVFCPESLSVVQSWFQCDAGAEEKSTERKYTYNQCVNLYGSSTNQVSGEAMQLRRKIFGKQPAFLSHKQERKKHHPIENDEDSCTEEDLLKYRKQQHSSTEMVQPADRKRKLNSHDELLEQLRDREARRKAKNGKQKRRKQLKKEDLNSIANK
uniref:AlNc14C24G2398 protein n=1 Tax=Albugo laibachii Nc14 TaxID=890382 RepID=F0W698_9STRA|nr:AlNc14C24G2398 [Albugo laibachii Nc14]|eukprot:CCA16641.1 AlNc14C24G2398 [Albugo laibachii Nc14]